MSGDIKLRWNLRVVELCFGEYTEWVIMRRRWWLAPWRFRTTATLHKTAIEAMAAARVP